MIAHFDVDAFYASVAVRDDPSLSGKPVAVAGSSRRAVVLTASYEARPFGVRSAMPLYKARAACPQLVVVRPDMAKYKQVSREIFAILERRGHAVEGLSMDEAFVDFAGAAPAAAVALAAELRGEILAATGLTVSAGVASGKMIAKIASDSCKPNGLLAIAPGEEAQFLAPLPVGRLWGVGPKTQRRLLAYGIGTIGEVAALDDARLHELFGSWGNDVRELARGIDRRSVESERETKSISTEETFEYDVTDERALIDVLRQHARELAEKLTAENLSAATVGVKIKRADFTLVGRQTHLEEPTRDARHIFRAAVYCLRRARLEGAAVRLLGTRVASLVAGEPLQGSLF
ncbi:MAG: DNA polymerase IV [Candidatus Eremiobacteraeota bacterium]|nr:DNA polymerase IV [Candidatus Eremiobacteraeota bacterium]MBV8283940.1 DNA polymerase IV [Candidatus Eremiobacteraeota bacterium]MBV8332996.1 DNA polymerase IV [Candidatus Eremiobacteraeota bacterium]MBV8582528.1 DNA polymerase IV [Candidatus Eremiobacteraeota bacterium]MBV8722199.1 DNA polymerase IV [Candidatus Eremiobacteraeota bacterium]